MNETSTLHIKFPDKESMNSFVMWFSQSGEQDFMGLWESVRCENRPYYMIAKFNYNSKNYQNDNTIIAIKDKDLDIQ